MLILQNFHTTPMRTFWIWTSVFFPRNFPNAKIISFRSVTSKRSTTFTNSKLMTGKICWCSCIKWIFILYHLTTFREEENEWSSQAWNWLMFCSKDLKKILINKVNFQQISTASIMFFVSTVSVQILATLSPTLTLLSVTVNANCTQSSLCSFTWREVPTMIIPAWGLRIRK